MQQSGNDLITKDKKEHKYSVFSKKNSESKSKIFQFKCHCRFQWRCWCRYANAEIFKWSRTSNIQQVLLLQLWKCNCEKVRIVQWSISSFNIGKSWNLYFCEILQGKIFKKSTGVPFQLLNLSQWESEFCLTFVQSCLGMGL